jgi:hypothetical protein
MLSMIVPELSTGAEVIRNRPADHPVLFEALLDAVEESARGDAATGCLMMCAGPTHLTPADRELLD